MPTSQDIKRVRLANEQTASGEGFSQGLKEVLVTGMF